MKWRGLWISVDDILPDEWAIIILEDWSEGIYYTWNWVGPAQPGTVRSYLERAGFVKVK